MSLLALLQNGWSAFSLLSLLAGGAGLALVALALVAGAYLPAFVRHVLLAAGVLVVVGAALFQAGQARGAREAFERDAGRALAAERTRAGKAERLAADIAAQATADLAAERDAKRILEKLNDDLRNDPRMAGECLDRDWARRLRAL